MLDQETDPTLLSLAAQRVHQHGALLIAQISHSGGKARPGVNGRPPLSPGDLTPQLLDRLVEQFRHAARTAQMAGFDGVQVHCAHNYLLSSFLNLRWNHREDAYGGSLENQVPVDPPGPCWLSGTPVVPALPSWSRWTTTAVMTCLPCSGSSSPPAWTASSSAAWTWPAGTGRRPPSSWTACWLPGGRPHRTHLPGGRRLFPRCGRKGAGRRCPLCLPLQGADLSARLRGADGKRPDREPLPGLQPLLQCVPPAPSALCAHTEVIPSWEAVFGPYPPDFPRARSRIGSGPASHFCPPVPALKKNRKNRKKDLTPAEKLV